MITRLLTSFKILLATASTAAVIYYLEMNFQLSNLWPRPINLGLAVTALDLSFFLIVAIVSTAAIKVNKNNSHEKKWGWVNNLIILGWALLAGATAVWLITILPPDSFPANGLSWPKIFRTTCEEYLTIMIPWVGLIGATGTLVWWQYYEPKKRNKNLRLICCHG